MTTDTVTESDTEPDPPPADPAPTGHGPTTLPEKTTTYRATCLCGVVFVGDTRVQADEKLMAHARASNAATGTLADQITALLGQVRKGLSAGQIAESLPTPDGVEPSAWTRKVANECGRMARAEKITRTRTSTADAGPGVTYAKP